MHKRLQQYSSAEEVDLDEIMGILNPHVFNKVSIEDGLVLVKFGVFYSPPDDILSTRRNL